MPKLRCLYLDDNSEDRTWRVAESLEEAVPARYKYATMKLEAEGFEEGRRRLRTNPDAYQLLVIDLLERVQDGDKSVEREVGQADIRWARSHCNAAVLAISRDAELLERIEPEVHATVLKARIPHDPRYLPDMVKQALERADIEVPIDAEFEVEWDDKDLRLSTVVHTIGKQTLRYFVASLYGRTPVRAEFRYVRAGLSGANVLHFTLVGQDPDDGRAFTRDMLLKASRDGASIRAEYAAWDHAHSNFPVELLPHARRTELTQSRGWHGFASALVDGVTLTDWLASGAQEDDAVERVFDGLFLSAGLSRHYLGAKAEKRERAEAMLARNLMTLGRKARVLEAIDQLRPLVEYHPPHDTGSVEFVKAYVIDGLPRSSKWGVPAIEVLSHGDLHGRNVLVTQRTQAILLDPADVAWQHWAADWGRLIIDLLLSGLSEQIAAYDWRHLAAWREFVAAVVVGGPIDDHVRCDCCDDESRLLSLAFTEAVRWLRNNAEAVFKPLHHTLPSEWELRLALAIELLRGSYRLIELPPPVRALSLLAAADALRASEAEMPA